MTEQQFRIPKIKVPIICHTNHGERIAGEIFLDLILSEGYDVNQVLDFFNAQTPFFPIRNPATNRTVLVQKESVVQVDIPQLMTQYTEQTSTFTTRKDAMLYLQTLGPVRVTIIVDLPEEYSRILDLVNMARRSFFPAVANGIFALLSIRHIYKIEEL
jgi:hypothetical protein